MPESTITSSYVHSRVDLNTFIIGNPMPESPVTLCQSRLCSSDRDFWLASELIADFLVQLLIPTTKADECFTNYQPIGKESVWGRDMDTVARWQKVLCKSSNVAEEKIRWQKKLIAEIWHNFTKSGRRQFSTIIFSFEKVYFNMKSPVGCYRIFSLKIAWTFPKIGRTFWYDWLEAYAVTL